MADWGSPDWTREVFSVSANTNGPYWSPQQTAATPSRPAVQVEKGDLLLTPQGVATVLSTDHARDWVNTDRGTFEASEIEELSPPDLTDPTDVEAWLSLAGQVVPRGGIRSEHVACSCACGHCYALVSRDARTLQAVNRNHFRQNDTCTCAQEPRCLCAQ